MQTKTCPHCGGSGLIPDNSSIGAEMQKLRTQANITLREVAGLMNISIGYLSDLEHGRKRWSRHRIIYFKSVVATIKEEQQIQPASVSATSAVDKS